MRKLLAIIFGIGIIFVISLIISLIPLNLVGSNFTNLCNKQNITISTASSWNFRPIGLKATNSKFEYSTKIEKNTIKGYGENLIVSLTGSEIYVERLVFDLHIEKESSFDDFINDFLKEITDKHYSVKIGDLIINIYRPNEEGGEVLVEEILLNEFEATKTKKTIKYALSAGINKQRKVNFLLTKDIRKKGNYEINTKIESDNLYCYLYKKNTEGNVNCKVKNILGLMEDLGVEKASKNYKNYKNLLDKTFSFDAKILDKDILDVDGKILVNKNVGTFKIKGDLAEIQFENLDFDKTSGNENENSEDGNDDNDISQEEKLVMSGKENKIIEKSKKKDELENINCFAKVVRLFCKKADNLNINLKLKIDNALFNSVGLKNIVFDVEKESKKNTLLIKQGEINFSNSDDKLTIKSTDNEMSNMLIFGSNLTNFIKLLNIQIVNPDFQHSGYSITGAIKLATDEFTLQDIALFVGDKQIMNYNKSIFYDIETKKVVRNVNTTLQNIDIGEFFNINLIYSDFYKVFMDFQAKEKQDVVFWKKLFKKREQQFGDNVENEKYILSNVVFEDNKIENLAYEFHNSKKSTNISINSLSSVIDGTLDFKLTNTEGKEHIECKINAKEIDISNTEKFEKDVESATGQSLEQIFFSNKDYNIPSLIGLNGNIDVKIDALRTHKNILTDMIGNFSLRSGIFESDNFNFKYANGDVKANVVFSLQETPEMQLGLAISGVNIKKTFTPTLDGYFSMQGSLKSYGFNPRAFLNGLSGSGHLVLQNVVIPNFNLLSLSQDTIKNGVSAVPKYYDSIVESGNLVLPKVEGDFVMENGVARAVVSSVRELLSSSFEIEYDVFTKIIKKMIGTFSVIISRKKMEKPMQIYLPVACNKSIDDPSCLVDWGQMEEVIKSIQ